MLPKVEALTQQFLDVVFLKVDIEENAVSMMWMLPSVFIMFYLQDIAIEYKVTRRLPTFVLMKNKNRLETVSGAWYEHKLQRFINRHR